MNVLILPSWYLPEGGQFCKEQAFHLNKMGFKVSILANVELPWKKYGFKAFSFPYGFNGFIEDGIFTYRHYSFRIPKSERLNQKKWIRTTLRQFEVYIRKYGKPDIIHAHSSMWGGYVAYLIKQKYHIPYVITEHRGRFSEKARPNAPAFKDWYHPFLQKAFSNANVIIPVSDLLIKKIREFAGESVPIQAVSNIVDTDFFHLREEKKNSAFTFFTANSFHDAKGYDILLMAFDLVCSKGISYIKLIIAGNGFNDRHFQTCLSQCTHKDKITFTGFLGKDDVRKQLWSADSYVLASRTEAQPISVLEALSTGLPVVCTEVVPEGIIIQEVGYRVPVNHVEELAEAMIKMILNRQEFNSDTISTHAHTIASPSTVIGQLIRIYHSI